MRSFTTLSLISVMMLSSACGGRTADVKIRQVSCGDTEGYTFDFRYEDGGYANRNFCLDELGEICRDGPTLAAILISCGETQNDHTQVNLTNDLNRYRKEGFDVTEDIALLKCAEGDRIGNPVIQPMGCLDGPESYPWGKSE